MTSVALKYRWRRPPSELQTLQGSDGDRDIGRIERAIAGDYWLWFLTCDLGVIDIARHCHLNGAARTAAHAAAACEVRYEALTASIAGATS